MRTRDEKISFKRREITGHLRRESARYLRLLADLWAVSSLHEARLDGPLAVWKKDGRVPTLPQQLIAQRMARTVEQYLRSARADRGSGRCSGGPAESAQRPVETQGAGAGVSRQQSFGVCSPRLFAVIDDAPPEDKLRRAQTIFDISVQSPEETLERLIGIDPWQDPSAIGIVLAALYSVWNEEITALVSSGQDDRRRDRG